MLRCLHLLLSALLLCAVGCGAEVTRTATGETTADTHVEDRFDQGGDDDADSSTDLSERSTPGDSSGPTSVPLELLVTVEADPRSPLQAVVHVTTTEETEVRVRASRGGEATRTTPWSEPNVEHTVEVLGLAADSTWDLLVEAEPTSGGDRVTHTASFQSGSLPEGMPNMAVTVYDAEQTTPGLTFFGVTQLEKPNDPKLPLFVAVDLKGEIVWLYQDEETNHDRAARAIKVLDEDTLLLLVGDGFRTVSLAGDLQLRVSSGPQFGGTIHHDVVALNDGGFLVLGRDQRELELETTGEMAVVKGDRVFELDEQGATIWEWSTFDHLDPQHMPTSLSQKPNPKDGSYDWTHGNGLVVLEGGDFLLSMRHQHQVARVSRETGEVVWLLGDGGDFNLLEGQWFYGQHAPTFREDGTLLLYDNGNDRPSGPPLFSRAVGYSLDVEALTATETLSWTVPEYTSFLGGVQPLPGDAALICAGGVRNANGPDGATSGIGRVIEINKSGEEIWRLEVEGNMYRALRVEGLLWRDD